MERLVRDVEEAVCTATEEICERSAVTPGVLTTS